MSNLTRKVRTWFIPILILTSLLCAGYAAAENDNPQQQQHSQGEEQADEFEDPNYTPPADIEERLQSLKMPHLERKYLGEKYPGLEGNETFSNLKQTEYGPAGKLHISGKIAPKGGWGSILEGKENKDERARAIARAYIAEEVSIFGIIDMEELKEYKFSRDEIGTAHIKYQRYVGGLRIDNSYIFVHIRPDETISSLMAQVIAPPPALYQAIANKTISKGKVRKIIRDDLKSSDPDVSVGVSKAQKEAILDPPYVIWNVEARSFKTVNGQPRDWQWEYKIDAFTGEIIQKRTRPKDSARDPLR